MSRRWVLVGIVLVFAAMPLVSQVNVPPNSGTLNYTTGAAFSPGFSNGPELFNGDDGIVYYFGCPSIGNVPGSVPPVVNLTPPDQRIFVILPRELMNSSNGTPPNPGSVAVPPGYSGGTMEFVGQQVSIFYSYWNNPGGALPVMFDQTFDTVVYPDGAPPVASRRFPNYPAPVPVTGASNAFLTIAGGPIALPPPVGIPTGGCTAGAGVYGYTLQIDYAYTGAGGSGPPGFFIPADGNTDVAVTLWVPSGMALSTASGGTACTGIADPTMCETGGNYTFMALASTCAAPCTYPSSTTNHEHVALGLTPTNRNPYGGWVGGAGVVNNWAPSDSWMNQIGFREPFVQFSYNPFNQGATAFWGREQGAGAMNMDATGLTQIQPGMRMQCTPCLGNIVAYAFQADPVNYTFFSQPGVPVTPSSNLLLNPNDPTFFLVTPLLDSTAVTATNAYLDQYVVNKHVADTPLVFNVFGPIGAPVPFWVQGFVIDPSVVPFTVRSSNVARGELR